MHQRNGYGTSVMAWGVGLGFWGLELEDMSDGSVLAKGDLGRAGWGSAGPLYIDVVPRGIMQPLGTVS